MDREAPNGHYLLSAHDADDRDPATSNDFGAGEEKPPRQKGKLKSNDATVKAIPGFRAHKKYIKLK